jgi:hypothetical protein
LVTDIDENMFSQTILIDKKWKNCRFF